MCLLQFGRIAAGTPIEALSDPTSYMSVPDALVSGGEHFALEIVGDSMIEAGIHEGDTVIIKRTDNANSGDIVVATTISPLLALSVRLIITVSPSWIPASIIESPTISRAKCSPPETRASGTLI